MTKIALKSGGSFEVLQDEDPLNPRKEWDNLSVMVCFHRRYNLGDEHDYRSEDFQGWAGLAEQIEKDHDVVEILPLYLMDHSGITISASSEQFRACDSAAWDWGRVGLIYVTKAAVLECFGGTEITPELRERARKALIAEVEVYNQYLTGDVYGFQVRQPPCEKCGSEEEVEDSCWGFLGSDPEENGMLDHLDTETREQVLAAL